MISRRYLKHRHAFANDVLARLADDTPDDQVEVDEEHDREEETFIETLATNRNVLHLLFEGFATVFTYDEHLRTGMGEFWPWALGIALDAVGDGSGLRSERHWFDYMAAALLPTPSPHSWDPDIDGTLTSSRYSWIQPHALVGQDERWLQLARWEPKAVDAIIKFGKSAPMAWQTTVALTWIEAVIDGRFVLIANHLYFLEEWFSEVRKAGSLDGDGRQTPGPRSKKT